MPLPFEKQPRESDKAFAAFSLYLSLGAERSTLFTEMLGFVELEEDTLAETAVRSLNGKLFAGRALTVSWATPVRQSA